MATHSPSERRRSPAGVLGAGADVVGPRGVPSLATRRGRKPRVPLTPLLPALTWHVMQDTGTLAEHLLQLFREPRTDSSWSDRRLRLPWEIFAVLMRRVRAWLAAGGPRGHAVQSDQHAPESRHVREGGEPSGPSRLREDDHGRAARSGPAQSAGCRQRSPRRVRVGVGAAGVPARRPPAPSPPQSQSRDRMARGARDSRAGQAEGPPRARAAAVDQSARPRRGARARTRCAAMRVGGNTSCIFEN